MCLQEVWFAASLLCALFTDPHWQMTVTSWHNIHNSVCLGSLCRRLWTSFTCTSPRPSTILCSKWCWDMWSCVPATLIPSSRRCSTRTCARWEDVSVFVCVWLIYSTNIHPYCIEFCLGASVKTSSHRHMTNRFFTQLSESFNKK